LNGEERFLLEINKLAKIVLQNLKEKIVLLTILNVGLNFQNLDIQFLMELLIAENVTISLILL
jgi:hypothetical protein